MVLRRLRISLLLYLLLLVAVGSWLTGARSTDWDRSLWVVVYPINADGSEASAEYIRELPADAFKSVEGFFQQQAQRYGISLSRPVLMKRGPELVEAPPEPPYGQSGLQVMLWSLKLRFWAWQVDREDDIPGNVQLFVLYHDPERSPRLAHSLGLEKGLVGVVNAFASPRMSATNKVVIAHELLHTLGASDKYDASTNQPVFPAGFAERHREPLYPQLQAELMAGRIPLGEGQARQAENLAQVVIGPETAIEINWR